MINEVEAKEPDLLVKQEASGSHNLGVVITTIYVRPLDDLVPRQGV